MVKTRQRQHRGRREEKISRSSAQTRTSIGSLYCAAGEYLHSSIPYILAVIGVFFASILFGFLFPSLFAQFDEILRGIIDETAGLSTGGLIWYIFANNLQSTLYGMLFGVAFGIFPLAATVLNGVLIGYVLNLSYAYSGLSDFWRLLPHGIFELPAVFISLGLGIRLGTFIFYRNKLSALKYNLRNSLLVFLLVILPLLIIAAIIEGFLIAFS